ncbi:MAG TPA: acyl-CoA dehydrogenase family protein [Candidatus Eisenbacteria bacterium]|nr:acyl-CoA dehydrogenase family protein [Candidatus Eisenbacteria bacterium]
MSHIYGLDKEGQDLADAASRIARDVAGVNAADVDSKGRFPEESLAALARDGFMGLTLPRSVGGTESPPRVFGAVVEELAQGCASTAMIYVMHVAAAQAIASSATLGGKETLLRDIASGKHITTLAFSERGSRSNFWAPVSKLEQSDGGYRTDAQKSWVTSAHRANSYVSAAQRPGAASPAESTVYLVRLPDATSKVLGSFDGLGLRGNDSAPVSLERHIVREQDLVSRQGEGLQCMLEVVLPWFVVGTSAMANGLCLAAVADTAAHLTGAGLEHTGSRLRDLPGLRARLADMSRRTAESRSLLGYTVSEMEHPDAMTPLYVLQSRLSALQAAVEVTDLAMKACGGAAFSKHIRIERLFRDARAGWVMAPTVDHLEDFIGKALTGLPLL